MDLCIDSVAAAPSAGQRQAAAKTARTAVEWDWPAFCCAVVLAAIFLANPFNAIGFDDDWSYSRVALKLVETGTIQYNGWGSPLQLFQTLWAAPWIRILGYSYPVLQAATIPFSLGFVLLIYATGRRMGLAREAAAFCAIGTGTSPLFLPFAATFMTEAYGCFFSMACVYCALRALQAADEIVANRWLWAVCIAGLIGGANRRIVWAAPLALIPCVAWERRFERRVAINAATSICFLGAAIALVLHWFSPPYAGLEIGRDPVAWLLEHKTGQAILFIVQMLLLCVMLAIPAVVASLPRIQRRHLARLAVSLPVMALLTLLGLAAGWPAAPYGNNMITASGISVGNQDAGGAAVIVLPTWQLAIMTGIVNLCAIRTVWLAVRNARRPNRSWLLIFAAFSISYLLLIFPGALLKISFDRYMLPLLPLLFLAIVKLAHPLQPRMKTAWSASCSSADMAWRRLTITPRGCAPEYRWPA